MPYGVFKRKEEYCVYKVDTDEQPTGDALGCHGSEGDAWKQVGAIEASEGSKALILKTASGIYANETDTNGVPSWVLLNGTVAKKAETVSDLRLMLLVTSNAYRDGEDEIVRQKAWEGYVESAWEGSRFVKPTPLLFWHAGEPVGEIIYADMEGSFLVEVARELADKQVDIMRGEDKLSIISRMNRRAALSALKPYIPDPAKTTVKEVWDVLESREMDWAVSPSFLYLKPDKADKVYEQVLKRESSVLPRAFAANIYTLAEVHRSIANE